MPRTLVAALLLALVMLAGACTSGEVDDTVNETAGGEDTVVGGADEATGAPTEAQADDVAPDPEIDASAAASEQAAAYSADVTLSGDAEVPGPGAEGSGTATLTLLEGEACIEGELTDVGAVMMGHIHTGTAEEAGDVLVDLEIATEGDGPFDSCVPVDQATADTIMADPSGFYVNLHTADFPDGAVRAQLS